MMRKFRYARARLASETAVQGGATVAGYVQAAKVGELSPGQMKMVAAGTQTLVLINVAGELYAINNECTHAACDLADGRLDGDQLECSCHGSIFNVKTGAVENPPAFDPVASYSVRIEGENVLIGPV